MNDVPFEDPRKVLARHGLTANKRFSQNFLCAPHVLTRIVDALELDAKSCVVELGPGLGTLTKPLLSTGARLFAVERDPRMLEVLHIELASFERLTLIEGDAAEVDYSEWALAYGGPIKVAGNLPYAITGQILRNLTEQRRHIARAALMIQKEVRDRLLAQPGTKNWGALSIFVQNEFNVQHVCNVPPGAFHPPPAVTSSVVLLAQRAQPRVEMTSAFQAAVRATFQARRKTLRNALGAICHDSAAATRALELAGIDEQLRGETLTVEQFGTLAKALADTSALAQPT